MAPFVMPEQASELYRLLSLAYEKTNKPDTALRYFKEHILLKDSLVNAETQRLIFELEARYENERKANEIALLKEDVFVAKAKSRFVLIIFLIVLLILLMIASILFIHRRTALFKAKLAIEESENLRLNVEVKNKELVTKAIHILNLHEMALEISEKMKSLLPDLSQEKTMTLHKIIFDIEKGLPQNAWKEFETRFEQVHQDFHDKLRNMCPSLTPTEVKICSFLRLNLTSKEISLLTSRSIGTIDNARSSIRKKLNLDNDSNLTTFLLTL
jgi:DNA-binding CsgD family transcriptional regulator